MAAKQNTTLVALHENGRIGTPKPLISSARASLPKPQILSPIADSPSSPLALGSVVSTSKGIRGIIKYRGPVKGKKGEYVGLELIGNSIQKGKNNGSINGYVCFTMLLKICNCLNLIFHIHATLISLLSFFSQYSIFPTIRAKFRSVSSSKISSNENHISPHDHPGGLL